MARALALALALMVLVAAPAAATFPGRNGDLLVTHDSGSKYSDQLLTLLRIHPRSGAVRELPICTFPRNRPYGEPPCFATGPPAASPDGRQVAVASVDRIRDTDKAWSLRVLSLEDGSQSQTPVVAAMPLLPYFYPFVRWSADAGSLLLIQAQSPIDNRRAPRPGRRGAPPHVARRGSAVVVAA